MRLSISVVFSSVAGYLLAFTPGNFDWITVLQLVFGGYFMVGASNAFNQVMERDLDALMDRTKNRPVAAGRMSVTTALTIATAFTLLGLVTLFYINPQTAMFGGYPSSCTFSYIHH